MRGVRKRFGKETGGERLGEKGGGRDDALGRVVEYVLNELAYLECVKAALGDVQDELRRRKTQAAQENEELRVLIATLRDDVTKQGEKYAADQENMAERQLLLKKALVGIGDLKEKTVCVADELDGEKLKVLKVQQALGNMQVSQQNGKKKEYDKCDSAEVKNERKSNEDLVSPPSKPKSRSCKKKRKRRIRRPTRKTG